jgi:hypothetical protein
MRRIRGRHFMAVVLVGILSALVASTAAADPSFEVMNAPEGVYWRSEPNWEAAERIAGFGVYNGTIVEVHCYQSGTAVEGSADTMWEQATDVGGQGYGSGWLNEHFINDGQPINTPSPGVPACGASSPPPPETQPSGGGLVFPIFNAEGGIYYRNSPHWSDTSETPGVGVYDGDQVQLICGAFGDPVGPFNDTAWSYVNNLSRSVGDGWVDEHFINDGAADNAFVAGEPMCGPEIPGVSGSGSSGASSSSGSSGGSPNASPTPGGSLYYSPYPTSAHEKIEIEHHKNDWKYAPSPAAVTIHLDEWDRGQRYECPETKYAVPSKAPTGLLGNKEITTLASWSLARNVPLLLLIEHPSWYSHINYILMFDPGNKKEYAEEGCQSRYHNLYTKLAEWLEESSTHRLAVLAGEVTADYGHPTASGKGHAGLQEYLFSGVYRARNSKTIRKQIVVCNYDEMSHEGIWMKFSGWMNKPPITVNGCPPIPGVPGNKAAPGWNP